MTRAIMGCDTPELDQTFLEGALRRLLENPVEKYLRIQEHARNGGLFSEREAQKDFNAFYRVRRGPKWQDQYCGLFPEVRRRLKGKEDRIETFAWALRTLRQRLLENGLPQPIEASFVSKLVATYDEDGPIIDSLVLSNFGLRLPYGAMGGEGKINETSKIYRCLLRKLNEILASSAGKSWIKMFDKQFGNPPISGTKKIDFLIWAGRR